MNRIPRYLDAPTPGLHRTGEIDLAAIALSEAVDHMNAASAALRMMKDSCPVDIREEFDDAHELLAEQRVQEAEDRLLDLMRERGVVAVRAGTRLIVDLAADIQDSGRLKSSVIVDLDAESDV